MSAIIVHLSDRRKATRTAIGPAWSPNWFAAEYAAAYARLFGSMAIAWDDCARKLRAADQTDGTPSDTEPAA